MENDQIQRSQKLDVNVKFITVMDICSMADPEFPRRGAEGRQLPSWGRKPIIWPNLS